MSLAGHIPSADAPPASNASPLNCQRRRRASPRRPRDDLPAARPREVADPRAARNRNLTESTFNQVLSASKSGPGISGSEVTSYEYDLNGNRTESVSISDVSSFVWDARPRLALVASGPSMLARFGYAPNGRRVRIESSSTLSRVLSDGWQDVRSYDGDGVWTGALHTAPSTLDRGLAQHNASPLTYLVSDAVGTVYGSTDETGESHEERCVVDAFGAIRSSSADSEACSFTGRPQDIGSPLIYVRHRYFDAQTGGFVSPDPLGEGQQSRLAAAHRYQYASHSPTLRTDPHGLLDSAGVAPYIYREVAKWGFRSIAPPSSDCIEASELARIAIDAADTVEDAARALADVTQAGTWPVRLLPARGASGLYANPFQASGFNSEFVDAPTDDQVRHVLGMLGNIYLRSYGMDYVSDAIGFGAAVFRDWDEDGDFALDLAVSDLVPPMDLSKSFGRDGTWFSRIMRRKLCDNDC